MTSARPRISLLLRVHALGFGKYCCSTHVEMSASKGGGWPGGLDRTRAGARRAVSAPARYAPWGPRSQAVMGPINESVGPAMGPPAGRERMGREACRRGRPSPPPGPTTACSSGSPVRATCAPHPRSSIQIELHHVIALHALACTGTHTHARARARAHTQVLAEMDAANMKRDVFTYNALLNCQSKARHLPSSEPASLLASMDRDQVASQLHNNTRPCVPPHMRQPIYSCLDPRPTSLCHKRFMALAEHTGP